MNITYPATQEILSRPRRDEKRSELLSLAQFSRTVMLFEFSTDGAYLVYYTVCHTGESRKVEGRLRIRIP